MRPRFLTVCGHTNFERKLEYTCDIGLKSEISVEINVFNT